MNTHSKHTFVHGGGHHHGALRPEVGRRESFGRFGDFLERFHDGGEQKKI